MWDWFTLNSIWILIISAIILILLLVFRNRVRDKITKAMAEKWQVRTHGRITIAFWTLEGIASVIIAIAMVAFILSEEGITSLVTTETILTWLLQHGTRIFIILLVGIGLWYGISKFLPPLVRRVMTRPVKGESKLGIKKRADTLTSVFTGLGKILIVLLVIFMILSELDISIGPILAGFGVVGIAVGFGAQYMIRDLIAGIFILIENQYRVGDVAKVADIAGWVEEINLRKTVIRDLDGIVHHVPNGEIRVASNYSRHFSRINLNISVAYGTDLDHAIRVVNRVGQELANDENWHGRIIRPPYVLRVDNLGDSGIDIKIVGDVRPLEQWAVMGELRLRIKNAFDAEDIEIPWPHIKVYFGNMPGDRDLVCKTCSHANPPGSKFCSSCGVKISP
ncbi:mechanosensitive ion channel domain-containing protein [Chloroflexota bacterium]